MALAIALRGCIYVCTYYRRAPDKRATTLREGGLEFEDAAVVFQGPTIDIPDERRDYGESRVISFGYLMGRMVAIGWTASNGKRRVFSMRKANERE